MKILFDFLPIVGFFVAFKVGGIYVATGTAIVISLSQIIYLLARRKKIDLMLIISTVLIVFLGSATIFFHNEWFIKWKPTILYALFGVVILVSDIFFHKNIFKAVIEESVILPDSVWRRISRAWAVFFFVLAVINIYVAYHFSTHDWVNFKLFGLMGLMFVPAIGQSIWIVSKMPPESPPESHDEPSSETDSKSPP